MRINNIRFKFLEEIQDLPIDTFDGAFDAEEVTASNFSFEKDEAPSMIELAIFKIRGNHLIPVKNDVPTFFDCSGYATSGSAIFDISLMDLPVNDSYVTIMKIGASGVPLRDYVKSITWVKK